MATGLQRSAGVRILVSNDDGVYSPGILALAEVAAELYAGAAGAAVGAGLARAVPALLGIPLDPWRALPVTLLATVAAACAAAASLVPDAAEGAP